MPTVEDYLREEGVKNKRPIKKCRFRLIPLGFGKRSHCTLYTCLKPSNEMPMVEPLPGKEPQRITRIPCLGRNCTNYLNTFMR